MKRILLITVLATFCFSATFAQQGFIGIQNSPRKGMLPTTMNPSEINHLSRKVEVNLFSVSAAVTNDVLYFNDFLDGDDILNLAFERADGPVNIRSEVNVLGPSFGIKAGSWSFGITTRAFAKVDAIDLDPELGRAFSEGDALGTYRETGLSLPFNQRVNVVGWMDIGLLLGRELIKNDKHSLALGGAARVIIPGAYVNLGLNNLQGSILQENDRFSLTNATGELNLSYSQERVNEDLYGIEQFSISNISGVALDFGITHQLKKGGKALLSSAISLTNIGSLNLGASQVNHTYSMNIPEGEHFFIDELEGSLDEIEDQLLESGYFSVNRESALKPSLPRLFTAYTDIRLANYFYLSVFGQYNLTNPNDNRKISAQNLLAITPRVQLGIVELYSPWANYQTAGLTGGLGLRVGGFFVGSNAVITGLVTETKQIDAHVGFSMGFGKL